MIHSLYGIYDQKARCLVNTFMSLNDATAERSFKAMLVTPENSVFTDNPSDFNLIKIIDIDDQNLPNSHYEVVFGGQYSSDLLHSQRIENAKHRAEIDSQYQKSMRDLLSEYYEKKIKLPDSPISVSTQKKNSKKEPEQISIHQREDK